MGSKSRDVVSGYQYFWGMHVIPCAAPIDGVFGLKFDERAVTKGVATGGTLCTYEPDLYGGQAREGGVGGYIDIETGLLSGDPNEYLEEALNTGEYTGGSDGSNPALVSSFIGVFAFVFRQFWFGNLPRYKRWQAKLRNCFNTYPEHEFDDQSETTTRRTYKPDIAATNPDFDFSNMNIFVPFELHSFADLGRTQGALTQLVTWLATVADENSFALRLQPYASSSNPLTEFERVPFASTDLAAALSYISGLSLTSDTLAYPTEFFLTDGGITPAQAFFESAEGTAVGGTGVLADRITAATGLQLPVQDNALVRAPRRVVLWLAGNASGLISGGFGAAREDGREFQAEHHAVSLDAILSPSLINAAGTNSIENVANPIVFDDNVAPTDAELLAAVQAPFISHADCNGIHILRHVLIAPNAGGDGDVRKIGSTFTPAAQTVFDEGFGFSFYWDKNSMTRDEFRKHVEGHLNCRSRFDPNTEQWEVKLIRPDYVRASLPMIGKGQIVEWLDEKTPRHAELPNQVTINWTRRDNGEPAATTMTNVAALFTGGPNFGSRSGAPRIKNISINYEGCTHPDVAEALCQRELLTRTYPIRTGQLRLAYLDPGLNEGDAFVLTDDRVRGYEGGLVCRVEEIEETDGKDNSIIVRFSQDIWAGSSPSDLVAGQDDVADTGQVSLIPQVADPIFAEEMAYYDLVFSLGQAETDQAIANDDGFGAWQITGARPNSAHLGSMIVIEAAADDWENAVEAPLMPTWQLNSQLDKDPEDNVFQCALTGRENELQTNDIVQIGSERMRLDSIVINTSAGTATFTVGRAILDTVPAEHAAGADVMAFDGFAASNALEYTDGESVTLRVLPRTTGGQLNVNLAADSNIAFTSRPNRPYPVGQLRVDGSYHPSERSGTVTVTWAHRNRLTQTSEAPQDHLEGNITPEVGVTLDLIREVIDDTDTVTFSDTVSITSPETAQTVDTDLDELLPNTDGLTRFVRLSVRSTRDGLTNWQTPSIQFQFEPGSGGAGAMNLGALSMGAAGSSEGPATGSGNLQLGGAEADAQDVASGQGANLYEARRVTFVRIP